jgi:hypothetical protein
LKFKIAMITLLLSANASAVTSSSVGKIAGLRVEETTGLASLPQNISDDTGECSRVWIDLTEDSDRVAYSTFLMAFAADKTVHIRAESNGSKRYGACDFYDIYIPRQ